MDLIIYIFYNKNKNNTFTVETYCNGTGTKDSSSGNLLEYLSLINLWMISRKYGSIKPMIVKTSKEKLHWFCFTLFC